MKSVFAATAIALTLSTSAFAATIEGAEAVGGVVDSASGAVTDAVSGVTDSATDAVSGVVDKVTGSAEELLDDTDTEA